MQNGHGRDSQQAQVLELACPIALSSRFEGGRALVHCASQQAHSERSEEAFGDSTVGAWGGTGVGRRDSPGRLTSGAGLAHTSRWAGSGRVSLPATAASSKNQLESVQHPESLLPACYSVSEDPRGEGVGWEGVGTCPTNPHQTKRALGGGAKPSPEQKTVCWSH